MKENLKQARMKAEMTQQQVADRLGVSLWRYRALEAGSIVGLFQEWDALEDLLNVHQRYLREESRGTDAEGGLRAWK